MNPASSSFARWRINFGISIALRGPISDGAMAYRDPAFFASPSAFVLRNCLSVRRCDPLYLDYRPVDYAGGGNRAVERSIQRRRRSHDRRGEGQTPMAMPSAQANILVRVLPCPPRRTGSGGRRAGMGEPSTSQVGG